MSETTPLQDHTARNINCDWSADVFWRTVARLMNSFAKASHIS